MIEVTPTTELPIWPTMLDGNTDLYEPQQLEYLDGNLKWKQATNPVFPYTVEIIPPLREAFDFEDNGQAIVCTNNVDFTVLGNTISYKGIGIDLGKAFQVIDDLIVLKAKTPGFYVWTTSTGFGSFLVHQGVFKQHLESKYINTDFTFVELYPKERDYMLVSQVNSKFKSIGNRVGTEEKLSTDRPLYFYSKKRLKVYSDNIIQQFKHNYSWRTDNFNTVFINSKAEKLKCFILIKNKFYWADLTFKEEYQTIPGYYPIDEKTGSIYTITNLSYTKAERVLYYGDKLLVIKEYNKSLGESI